MLVIVAPALTTINVCSKHSRFGFLAGVIVVFDASLERSLDSATEYWIPALCHSLLRREEKAMASREAGASDSRSWRGPHGGLFTLGGVGASPADSLMPPAAAAGGASGGAKWYPKSMLNVPIMLAACKMDKLGGGLGRSWAEGLLLGLVMACSAQEGRADVLKLGQFLMRLIDNRKEEAARLERESALGKQPASNMGCSRRGRSLSAAKLQR